MEAWTKMLKPPTLSAVMKKQEKGLSAPQHFGSVLGTLSCGGHAASFPPSRLASLQAGYGRPSFHRRSISIHLTLQSTS